MFDLFRSRDKAVRYLLGGLLMLVALSMVVTLIPGYGSGTGVQDTVVAEIGKDTVSLREVQLAIQTALRGKPLPPEMLPHYVPQLVEQMITERALAFEARRLGFQVTDADTANAIRSMVPQLFQDGKFVGKDAYASVLAQQNLTIPEFESDIARQVLVGRLRDVVLEGIVISPLEVEQEFRRRNEKAKIEYVKLSPEKFRSEVEVTPAEMREYFNRNRASYRVPEKRGLKILVLDQAKIEQSTTVPDNDLRRAYETNKEKYRTPERVKVRHILLTTTGKSKEEEAAVKAKAEGLLKQVKEGADFADLARKNSQDPGSASKGGDLDWVVRGQTVPEFEKAAFSLKPKEISDLVKTQYGYHIIQGGEKEEARLKSFEEVKNELAANAKRQRVNDRLQELADKAQAALKKNPQHPEQVANELNISMVTVEKSGPGDPIPEIGVRKEFEDAITGLRKGDVSQPVVVPGNKLVIATVTDVFPTRPAEFGDVQDQVRNVLVEQKVTKLVDQRATELFEKAKAFNGDLKKAAQSMRLEFKTSDEFTRQGAVEGLGSSSYVPDAFTKAPGTLFGPVSIPDAKIVARVVSRTEPNMGELGAQRDSLREELKGVKSRERIALFEDGLRQQLIKEGKVKIHQDVISRLTSANRG